MIRSKKQEIIDFLTFPLRAFTLFERDRFGLSSLRTERFDYVAREVRGYCLDVGCGRENQFISKILKGRGKGIDVFEYQGLTTANICKDLSKFPYKDNQFGTATFIANVNHIPQSKRDIELKEAYRCLKSNGIIIVTMGNPLAEIVVHKVVYIYDKILKTNLDMDTERGMDAEEAYYLKDDEILARLKKAGFKNIQKKYFFSQWGFNHLFIGVKK
jgi:SAM-dependent methyltransferase